VNIKGSLDMGKLGGTVEQRLGRLLGAEGSVFFVPAGTAANVLGPSLLLRPFEAMICAESIHLNVDECRGAGTGSAGQVADGGDAGRESDTGLEGEARAGGTDGQPRAEPG
jgi:threonine aldolase